METKAIDRINAGVFFSALNCSECGKGFIVQNNTIQNISQAFDEYANSVYGFRHADCEAWTPKGKS